MRFPGGWPVAFSAATAWLRLVPTFCTCTVARARSTSASRSGIVRVGIVRRVAASAFSATNAEVVRPSLQAAWSSSDCSDWVTEIAIRHGRELPWWRVRRRCPVVVPAPASACSLILAASASLLRRVSDGHLASPAGDAASVAGPRRVRKQLVLRFLYLASGQRPAALIALEKCQGFPLLTLKGRRKYTTSKIDNN